MNPGFKFKFDQTANLTISDFVNNLYISNNKKDNDEYISSAGLLFRKNYSTIFKRFKFKKFSYYDKKTQALLLDEIYAHYFKGFDFYSSESNINPNVINVRSFPQIIDDYLYDFHDGVIDIVFKFISIDFDNYFTKKVNFYEKFFDDFESAARNIKNQILIFKNGNVDKFFLSFYCSKKKLNPKFIICYNRKINCYWAYTILKNYKNVFLFKESWRGLENKELSRITGIKNCILVHNSGFAACNKTLSGIIEMIKKNYK